MGQLTTGEAGADLVDRADVEALLRRFYGRALHDEVLAEPFAELRATGLETHVPTMCDFWGDRVVPRWALSRQCVAGAPGDPPACPLVGSALPALAHVVAQHR